MPASQQHQAPRGVYDLAALRYHWGGAYTITRSNGAFRAERADGLGCLEAATEDDLRALILDDYHQRPVPRDPLPVKGQASGDDGADQVVTVGERLNRVDTLDLDPIACKLMHAEPGEASLTLARADHDVALYRCFLKLCVLHPGATIVPTRRLDHVWHAHILDTAKYRADCDRVFGHFVDHFPYAGLGGEDDRSAWREDFARTRGLFKEHFGIEIGDEPAASACSVHGGGSDCCVGCVKHAAADARPRPERGRRP